MDELLRRANRERDGRDVRPGVEEDAAVDFHLSITIGRWAQDGRFDLRGSGGSAQLRERDVGVSGRVGRHGQGVELIRTETRVPGKDVVTHRPSVARLRRRAANHGRRKLRARIHHRETRLRELERRVDPMNLRRRASLIPVANRIRHDRNRRRSLLRRRDRRPRLTAEDRHVVKARLRSPIDPPKLIRRRRRERLRILLRLTRVLNKRTIQTPLVFPREDLRRKTVARIRLHKGARTRKIPRQLLPHAEILRILADITRHDDHLRADGSRDLRRLHDERGARSVPLLRKERASVGTLRRPYVLFEIDPRVLGVRQLLFRRLPRLFTIRGAQTRARNRVLLVLFRRLVDRRASLGENTVLGKETAFMILKSLAAKTKRRQKENQRGAPTSRRA